MGMKKRLVGGPDWRNGNILRSPSGPETSPLVSSPFSSWAPSHEGCLEKQTGPGAPPSVLATAALYKEMCMKEQERRKVPAPVVCVSFTESSPPR